MSETTPLWSDKNILMIAFNIATRYFMQPPPKEHPMTKLITDEMLKIRDEYEAALAMKDARIAALEAELAEESTLRRHLAILSLGGARC